MEVVAAVAAEAARRWSLAPPAWVMARVMGSASQGRPLTAPGRVLARLRLDLTIRDSGQGIRVEPAR